jgi:parallel beta-helix repeat protein
MKKVLILAIVMGMLLAGAANVEGAVYYVSQAGTGNGLSYLTSMSVADHNAGSFSPGDTIYLVDTISSRLEIPSSGTSGNEITYRGDYAGHPGVLTANTSSGTLRGEYKDYITIDGLEIKNGRIATAFLNGCDYITIKNCLIHDMTGATSKGIHFTSNTNPRTRNSNVVIGGAEGEGNEVYNVGVDTGGFDIGLAQIDNVIASYNKCYGGNTDTGIDGITLNYCNGGVIEYNELFDHVKEWSATYPDMGEDGLDTKGSSNIHIRYNHIYGNRAGGIGVNNSDAMQANCSNIYIYHNLIHDQGSNIVVSDLDENCYIWSNLIYNSTKSHGISCSNDGSNIHIYNNTLINNHGVNGDMYAILIGGTGSDYYVKNNILYSDTHNDLAYKASWVPNVNFDNNRYHYTDGAPRIRWDGVYKTLAQLQALGQETNGSEGDPGLNDVGNNDYTLASDSACIDDGSDLGANYDDALDPTNTDFITSPPSVYTLDQDNYGTGWEIGAYVYGSGESPDTEDPSVPQNLQATAVSSSQIDLSWSASTDNVGVTGYNIYCGGNYLDSTANTSYSDTGLDPDTTYSYTVSAYDAAENESNVSVSDSATTDPVSGADIYYVSQAGTGDGGTYSTSMSVADHNAGDDFSPGDVIYLVDTITSRIIVPSSGVSGDEITYRGDYSGHPGVIDCSSGDSFAASGKDYLIIEGLEIKDGPADGIYLSGGSNIYVRYNHIYGNTADGISLQNSVSDIHIYHNYVHNNNANINAPGVDNNVYIWSNLICESTGFHGISCSASLSSNIHIYNNTLINNHGAGDMYAILIGADYTYVKNNILYSDTHNDLVYKASWAGDANFDNNRYYYTGGAARIRWDGIYKTLAQVQALGQETNGSEGDPGLNDVGNDDYTLASDSACIDDGSDLGANYDDALDPTNTDFITSPPSVYTLDQDNYGTGWEIGAYVY